MKRLTTIVFGLLLTSSLTATAAYAQTTPSTSPQNSPSTSTKSGTNVTNNTTGEVLRDRKGKQLGERFRDNQGQLFLKRPSSSALNNGLTGIDLGPDLWLVISLTIFCGGLGGFVFELLNLQGNIEKPHKPSEDDLAAKLAYASPKNVIDLGVWARIIIGAAAAPPAMLFLRPESAFALLAMSVVAGSAGTAIFRSLQERVQAAIAHKEKDETQGQIRNLIDMMEKASQALKKGKNDEAEEILNKAKALQETIAVQDTSQQAVSKTTLKDKVNEVIDAFDNLKDKLIKASTSPKGETQLEFTGGLLSFIFSADLEQEDLDKIESLLSEIKGCYETIATRTGTITQNASKVDETIAAFKELKDNINKNSTRPGGKTTLQLTKGTSLKREVLDKVGNLLSELKGLQETLATPYNKASQPGPGDLNRSAEEHHRLVNGART
jgi:hypothetical protein